MNRNILRALVLDAFYQVLDNWVFRILTGLTLVPILFTFLVGFREEGVVLLFGWKTWSYADMPFGLGAVADPQGTLIEAVLQLFLGQVAGGLGILLSISATAFFVPRLLEKGAAELYFHKPVSRALLYLSRYFAGLVFITLTAVVLVGGSFLGLALVSRRADPGILLAAPTLVYIFALVFPFAMLVGVVTRSTVASILLAGLFFVFNGCIQQAWIGLEQFSDPVNRALIPSNRPVEQGEEGEEQVEREPRERSGFERVLVTTLDVVRTVLPKTSDADHMARKVRRNLSAPLFRDEDELVVITRLPEGQSKLASLPAPAELSSLLGGARFAASGPAPDEPGRVPLRFSLWSRPIQTTISRIGERERVREETASRAAEALEDELKKTPENQGVERVSMRLGDTLSCSRVTWSAPSGEGAVWRGAYVFKGAKGKTLFTLLIEETGVKEAFEEDSKRITRHVGLDSQAMDEWYPSRLRLDAPWRTNITFSVGSSLAFAALVLLLGIWRLGRIAF